MSEHDVAAKCARQVANLQAENERLRIKLIPYQDELEERPLQEWAAQVAGLQNEITRLLTGLRAAKLTAATQAAKVGNGFGVRGEWHQLAEQLQAVIDGPAYVAPDVIYEAALEVRAGTPIGLMGDGE